MSRDPEGESVAGECLLKALRSFDPAKGTPIAAYVVRCVRLGVMDFNRSKSRRRDQLMPEEYWYNEVYDSGDIAGAVPTNSEKEGARRYGYRTYEEEAELPISQEEWRLLTERYVDRVPMDVLARRRNTTVYQLKKALHAAVSRFTK